MKVSRKKIGQKVKKELLKEAGYKCANPGCPNRLTEIHHIKEWHMYHTNDQKDMIVLCPVCHEHVKRGELMIDDETLYRWKSIAPKPIHEDQLFIELAPSLKILLGTVAATSEYTFNILKFSKTNQLGVRIVDRDIFHINLHLTINGEEIVRISDDHLIHQAEGVQYSRRPGKVRITAAFDKNILPAPVIEEFRRNYEPDFAIDGYYTLLDIEILEPGKVRIKGIWIEDNKCIIITDHAISLIQVYPLKIVSLLGEGENSLLSWRGPVDGELFQI